MQTEIKSIEKQIKIAIDRCQINQIICVNYDFERNKTTLEQANKLLNSQMDYKIKADLLYFFNDIHDLQTKVILDTLSEEDAIRLQIDESIKNFQIKSFKIVKEKIYNYELNKCFVKLFKQINDAINEMNYHEWLRQKNPNVNEDVLYLLLNKKHEPFTKFKIDIDTKKVQLNQLAQAFIFRQEELKKIKDAIYEVYAKELYSPYITAIPEFKYTCTKTDICELAYAIQLSNKYFHEPEIIARTILKMFKVSNDDYSKALVEIRKRKKDKNSFIKKISENIENLKTPIARLKIK